MEEDLSSLMPATLPSSTMIQALVNLSHSDPRFLRGRGKLIFCCHLVFLICPIRIRVPIFLACCQKFGKQSIIFARVW